MTDLSLATNKKKKLTYAASIKGVEKAGKALVRLGFESKANFAESQLLSRSTVTKFFGRQAIQLDSFKRICEALDLKWEEIIDIEEVSALNKEMKQSSTLSTLEDGSVMTVKRQVAAIDKNGKSEAVIVLEGDINSVNNDLSVSIELLLRRYSGHTIKITDIKKGSIKLFIEGSQEDIQKLISLVESGEITELSSFPIESIQTLKTNYNNTNSEHKWHLITKIKTEGAKGKNLKDADFSDADLSGVDFSGADLSNANFSGADLVSADFRNAYLRDANFREANVINTRFGNNEGISEFMKLELIQRGAILEDTQIKYLANLHYFQGKYDEAEPFYKQILELQRETLGESHPNFAQNLSDLANLYRSQGRYNEAEPLYIQALELRRKKLGDNHPDFAQNLDDLANLYHSQGRYDEAEHLYKQVLELRKRILGENHLGFAQSLNNLAVLYYSQERYEKAEPLCIRALKIRKHVLGEEHPDFAQSLNNLAALYCSLKKFDKAKSLYIQALELRKRIFGENHPDFAQSLNNLAALHCSQEDYNEAEVLYKQALKIAELRLGANHPDTILYRQNLHHLQNHVWNKAKKVI